MKKRILVILAVIFPLFTFSQNSFPITGNVGIGTTSPNATLQIGDSNNSGNPAAEIEIKRLSLAPVTHAGSDWFFTTRDNNPYANLDIGYSNNKTITLRHDGNVGIGSRNPLAKLEINRGNVLVKNAINVDGSSSIMISQSIIDGNLDSFGTSIRTITQNAGYNIYGMQFFTQDSYLTGQTEKVRILGNGNVGIGTTNPTSKLTVAGNINSREVKVSVDAGADFVFEKDYALPSLQEVEKFVIENKHLPEIASAKEMQKEGINLSEMNIKLLQKIEELTLYLIEQNNQLKLQSDKIQKQNQEFEILKTKIKKLESKQQ